MKNTNRLTPRLHAQRADRFKFHRVIKALREIEEKEQNITKLLDEDDLKVKEETEEDRQERIRKEEDSQKIDLEKIILDAIMNSKVISMILAILVGLWMYALEVSWGNLMELTAENQRRME